MKDQVDGRQMIWCNFRKIDRDRESVVVVRGMEDARLQCGEFQARVEAGHERGEKKNKNVNSGK